MLMDTYMLMHNIINCNEGFLQNMLTPGIYIIYMCVCVCVRACMRVHAYIYIYIYIYIYTINCMCRCFITFTIWTTVGSLKMLL